jgi:hypothetical protein
MTSRQCAKYAVNKLKVLRVTYEDPSLAHTTKKPRPARLMGSIAPTQPGLLIQLCCAKSIYVLSKPPPPKTPEGPNHPSLRVAELYLIPSSSQGAPKESQPALSSTPLIRAIIKRIGAGMSTTSPPTHDNQTTTRMVADRQTEDTSALAPLLRRTDTRCQKPVGALAGHAAPPSFTSPSLTALRRSTRQMGLGLRVLPYNRRMPPPPKKTQKPPITISGREMLTAAIFMQQSDSTTPAEVPLCCCCCHRAIFWRNHRHCAIVCKPH